MAVIVRIKKTDEEGILVGTGYGAFHSARGNWFWGDLIPNVESGAFPMVAVCMEDGRLRWGPSEDIEVVSVDGVAPAELLGR